MARRLLGVRGLADDHQVVAGELVRGDFQVERGGPLPDPAGRVIVRPVARAVVAAEVSRIRDGHAAQVGADADQDDPLGLLDSLQVVLRVPQLGHLHGGLLVDLLLGSVAHEQRFAPPLESHVLAFRNVG